MVKAGQYHAGYRNDGAFMAAALFNTVIFDPEIRVLLVLDSGKRTL